MSKHFNDYIIGELERCYHRHIRKHLEAHKSMPKGDIYLLFMSDDPNDKISRLTVQKTVQKICFDANLGHRFSVRIQANALKDAGKESGDHIDAIAIDTSQPSSESNRDSGDGDGLRIDRQITQYTTRSWSRATKSKIEIVSSFSELFSSDSDRNLTTSSGSTNMALKIKPCISYSFRSSACVLKVMRLFRSVARSCVRHFFSRNTLSAQDKAPLSPTLFGPSIDEPLVTLLDHIYHTICWLIEPESSVRLRKIQARQVELPHRPFLCAASPRTILRHR